MADAGTDSDRSDAGSGSFGAVSPHASMFKSVSTEPHHAFALETYIRGTVDVESVAEVASVTTDTLLRVAVLHGPHVELLQTPLSRVAGREPVVDVQRVTLGATATSACWNCSGTCVVVGDAGGSLHFVTAGGALLFSQQIFEPGAADGSDDAAGDHTAQSRVFGAMAFATRAPDVPSDGTDELVVISADGQLLRFSNLSVKALEDAANSDSASVIRAARRSITLSKLAVSDLFARGVSGAAVACTATSTVVAVVGEGDTAAALFVSADSDAPQGGAPSALALDAALSTETVGCSATRVVMTPDARHVFLVGEDGTLSWWSVPGLALVAAWNTRGLRDAVLVSYTPDGGGNGGDGSEWPTLAGDVAPEASVWGDASTPRGSSRVAPATPDAASSPKVVLAAIVDGEGGRDGGGERLWLVEADLRQRKFTSPVSAAVRMPQGSLVAGPAAPRRDTSSGITGASRAAACETGVVVCSAWMDAAQIVLWRLSRAVPEAHVEALVAAGQVDAALAWATAHGMGHADVFTAQASVLAQRLGEDAAAAHGGDAGAGSDEGEDEVVEQLMAAMDEVSDLRRVTGWCVETVVQQRTTVSALLDYAERRLIARMEDLGIDEDDNEEDNEAPLGGNSAADAREAQQLHRCFAIVQEARRRWTSFGLLSPFGGGFDCAAWHQFRTVPLEQELRRLMVGGRVRVAIALWRRHATPALASVASKCIQEAPASTPVRAFAPWLRDEVVPLLGGKDKAALALWLARRAVEVEARTQSPHDALLLGTVLGGAGTGVLHDLAGREAQGGNVAAASHRADFVRRLTTPAQAVQRAVTGSAAFVPLVAARLANRSTSATQGAARGGSNQIADGDAGLAAGLDSPLAKVCALLSSLVYLQDVHGLALTLDQIQVDTAAGIGVALLDRVDDPNDMGHGEEAAGRDGTESKQAAGGAAGRKGAIEEHVRPWCRRHGVDCDQLLLTYVSELCTAIVGSDDLLEARCLAVLMCIHDPGVRVDAAMALLQAVSPPYSDALQRLVAQAVRWPSPRHAEVREQKRLMALHGVLRRYGIRHFSFDNRAQASMLVSFVTAQVHRSEALADALMITRAYPHLHPHHAHTAYLQNVVTAPLTEGEVAYARRELEATTGGHATDQAVLEGVLRSRAVKVSSDACLCLPQLAAADVLLAGQETVVALEDTLAECAAVVAEETAQGSPAAGLLGVAASTADGSAADAGDSGEAGGTPGLGIHLPDDIGVVIDGSMTAVEPPTSPRRRTGAGAGAGAGAGVDASDREGAGPGSSDERLRARVALSDVDTARWQAACAAVCAEAILERLLRLADTVDLGGRVGGNSDAASRAGGVMVLTSAGGFDHGSAGEGGAGFALDGDRVMLVAVTPARLAAVRTAATLQREFGVYLSLRDLASRPVCMALLQGAVAPVVARAATLDTVRASRRARPSGRDATQKQRRKAADGAGDDDDVGTGAGAAARGLTVRVPATSAGVAAGGDGEAAGGAGEAGGSDATAATTLLARAFRLAELMGIPREDLRALLARECARSGDVLASLRWCRDLSRRAASQSPDASNAATAATLRDVALTLSAYTVSHPGVFNVRPHTASAAAKARAHAPDYARQLLQQAVAISSAEELPHTLSLWAGADMVTQVLAKSEVGEYGRLWESAAARKRSGDAAGRLGSGTLGVSPSMVSPLAPLPAAPPAAGDGREGAGVAADEDRFACDVHADWFKETCMVLKTSRAMALVSRYAVAEQACRQEMDVVQIAGVRVLSSTSHGPAPPTAAAGHTGGRTPSPALRGTSPALGASGLTSMGAYDQRPGAAPASRKQKLAAASAALTQLVQYLAGHNAVQLAVHALLSSELLGDEQVDKLEDLVRALLLKVLRSRDVDTGTALGCMLSAPTSAAFHTFKSVLPSVMDDYPRLLRVACVGMDAATAWDQMQFQAECRTLHSNARWWMLMQALKLPVDTKLFTGMGGVAGGGDAADEYRRSLLPPLLENTGFDLNTALQYCSTFAIEPQAAVLMFIEYLLIHPAAQGKSNYKALILAAADKAPSGPLTEILNNAYQQADPVDYDRLQFICASLARASRGSNAQMARNADALAILRTFSATPLTAAPAPAADPDAVDGVDSASWADDEAAASLQTNPLPFHQLVADPWAVLRPYITVANLPRLVALAGALGLDPDHFYVHIIQQLVRRHTEAAQQRGTGASHSLHLGPGDRAMLSAVQKHLARIRDPQLRVDTAQWWAGQVAEGLAKVEAYDLVMRLATQWHEELLPTDAGFKLAPIAAEAARVAHSLRDRHRTALDVRSLAASDQAGDDPATESLLEFLDNPRELVCQIFHAHAAAAARELQQRHAGLGVTTRDGMEVHRVATGIAKRHKVDMLKVKRLLIQHWVFEDLAPDATATGVGSAPVAGTAHGAAATRGRAQAGADGGGAQGSDEAGDVGAGVGSGCSVFEPSPFEVAQEAEAEAELKIVYVLLPTDSDVQDAQAAASAEGGQGDAGAGAGAGAGASAPSNLVMSGAKALLNVATMRQSSKRSYRSRARAVSCVFRLLETNAINTIYAAGAAALASYWRYCLYMAEFEDMRIPQELPALQACSKPALARGLWRDHRHNPRAVRLIAQLLVDFSVNDANLWLAVLRQLRLFGQHRQLLALLEPLSALDCVRGSKEMATLWEQILLHPFKELGAAKARGVDMVAGEGKAGAIAVLEQVIVMLQRCPVLQLVDVSRFVAAFWELGPAFHSHAVRCAFALPLPVARAAALRKMVAAGVYVPVLNEVSDSVDAAAMMDVEGAVPSDDVELVRSVWHAVDDAGAHAQLQGTPYLEPMAVYLVTRSRITGLLATILKTGARFEEALALVNHYHTVHPSCASAMAATNAAPGASKWLPLQLFVRNTGLPLELLPGDLIAACPGTVAGAASPDRTRGVPIFNDGSDSAGGDDADDADEAGDSADGRAGDAPSPTTAGIDADELELEI